MILYVNGDSHTAAAEAVNPHAFAEDDPKYFYMGRYPHPDNLSVSWGRLLSDTIKTTFKCDAESASSNDRIIRTTHAWLKSLVTPVQQVLIIIQWSTWERQEWLIDDVYYQVNASGEDHVPEEHKQKYKEFVTNINWQAVAEGAHQQIWNFHQGLLEQNINHVFFNGNNHFGNIKSDLRQDWGRYYIGPYDPKMTYNQWLLDHGYQTVSPKSWHFGRDAHAAWYRFMLQYIMSNKLIT